MKVIRNKTFYDHRIAVDDCHFIGCYFDGCVMEATKDIPSHLESCNMQQCQYVGDGWPDWLIKNT